MPTRRLPAGISVLLVAVLVAFARPPGSAAHTDSTPPLATGLSRALAVPHVARGRTAAVALDLATGKTLFAFHRSLPLAPASNEKLAVTFAALTELGGDYEITTDVLGNGEQKGSTWAGDLILQGHGDPTLSTAGLEQLARSVAETGIRRVTGRVLADETAFDSLRTGPGWKPSFYLNESPPLSALSVDRGWARDPALVAGIAFKKALHEAGVTVVRGVAKGAAPPYPTFIATLSSPPLAAILQFMDRESDNYTAELLLKHLGTIDGGQGTSASGAAVVRRDLEQAGIPLAGVRIADGSGLSLLDRTTVATLSGILRAAWEDPALRGPFFDALSVAGENGTLAGRMRSPPARGNVVGKTGTTDGACALSGYVRRRYVFAVVQNGSPVSLYWARTAQDRFATVLARS